MLAKVIQNNVTIHSLQVTVPMITNSLEAQIGDLVRDDKRIEIGYYEVQLVDNDGNEVDHTILVK